MFTLTLNFDSDSDFDSDTDTDSDLLTCCRVDLLIHITQAFRFTSHLAIGISPLQGSLTC